ncbi:hypothetical protein GCM10023231_37540 [Olivibacter ginsenosidimutans]|uniref:Gliding motility lipoprotein GldH n=1 Tax=Olivibacter ginsenosidimutans TaxID=1176537 RepID=A0ABP9C5I8_9SPHI
MITSPSGKYTSWITYWSIIGLIIGLLLTSCSDEAIVDEFKPVPDGAWNYGFTPEFAVKIDHREIAYQLRINVRLSADYPYSNLFVLIHQTDVHKAVTSTKRIGLKVADKDGKWLGKGVGSLYSYQITYNTDYHFPDTGTYQFKIEQNMRDNPLKGVRDIGICIVPGNAIP